MFWDVRIAVLLFVGDVPDDSHLDNHSNSHWDHVSLSSLWRSGVRREYVQTKERGGKVDDDKGYVLAIQPQRKDSLVVSQC